MTTGWIVELRLSCAIIAAALIAAAITGHWSLWLLLAVSAILGWHLRNLLRLTAWLNRRDKSSPPLSSGIWGDVFDNIHRLQQRERQRKRRLADMLGQFQRSTAAMPDASVVLGPYGDIQWFNEAARSLLGFRARDVGQRIANLIRHPAFHAFLNQTNGAPHVELPSPVDDRIALLFQIVSYGVDQRLLLARDVTLLKRLEQVRTDFVANVSHELRTPLTVIHGYLETLAEHVDQAPVDWRQPIRLMYEQSLRMQTLVSDLLVLSRLEMSDDVADAEEVPVPELLSTIHKAALALSGPRRHRITLDVDESLWLRGSAQELHSAFSNIVFNAVQYTPDGGDIAIRWRADGTGANFEVSDSGIGIPAHHIPRLTERFYRVDVARSRKTGGTGLGLAIVKHVLQRHNARLRVESVVGRGSTFICDFAADSVVRRPQERIARC